MKTAQLLNYERDRWTAGDGHLAELVSAIDGAGDEYAVRNLVGQVFWAGDHSNQITGHHAVCS